MLTKHRGDSILEWIILASVVIAVLGVVGYGIASKGSAQGNNVSAWITSLNVPVAHP